MDRFLTHLPVITRMEVAVVAATVLFLCITPVLLAWSDARRRRRAMRREQALAVPTHVSPVSPDFASTTGEASERLSDLPVREPAMPELAAADARPADAAPPPAAIEPVSLVEPPSPVPRAVEDVPSAAPRLSDAVPALQVAAFTPPPVIPQGADSCQLIDLRQARLPDWPPDSVRRDAERRRIWEEGERLETRFDRQISTTTLSLPSPMQATTLGGVETDGVLFRLHFSLFEELWPTAPSQAAAEAVFEIDPAAGVLASWVEKR
jgi:hypothetical protein